MNSKISKRLLEILVALPIEEGQRIIEIGSGTGLLAREIVRRFATVHVLGLDRSAKAIAQSVTASELEISKGKLSFQLASIETFELKANKLFDFAFAIRVGVLDGRHPKGYDKALVNITKALKPTGKLFIDGGNPLKEIDLDKFR